MKRTLGLVASLAVLTACQDTTTTPTAPRALPTRAPLYSVSGGGGITGRYIVVFKDGVSDVNGRAASKVSGFAGRLLHTYGSALKGFAAELPSAAVAALQLDPDIAYIEQDQTMSISATESNATWGIDRIDQHALPLSHTYTYTSTGTGVTAYIIDTGILFTHSEFGGRASTGIDEVTSGGTAVDCNGHGTHVSGTVGGATYGVAKNVNLVAVRVLDCSGSGTTAGVIAGVDWVTAHHTANAVANMSLGGGASTALDNAVANSIASGVTYGIAAGNGNSAGVAQNACNSSPARVAAAITVAATDSTDKKASWSNFGTCVDIFAPGVSIKSSWYTSTTATNVISGTSMATPHVVGVAATYLAGHPGSTPQQVRDALVAGGTAGVVKSPGTGSPNVLLFTSY
jgi:subtilisin family serine protease